MILFVTQAASTRQSAARGPTVGSADDRIVEILTRRFRLVECVDGWNTCLTDAPRAEVVVAHLPEVTDLPPVSKLAAIADACPGGLIVIAPPRVGVIRRLIGARLRGLVLEDDPVENLLELVSAATMVGQLQGAVSSLRQAGAPPLFSAAIRQLVLHLAEADPIGTTEQLAKSVGCSTRYLRSEAQRLNVDLPGIVQQFKLLTALRLRQRGMTWERVALRIGYSAVNGLSEAAFRHFGYRLRGLDQREAAERLLRQIVGRLEGCRTRSSRTG